MISHHQPEGCNPPMFPASIKRRNLNDPNSGVITDRTRTMTIEAITKRLLATFLVFAGLYFAKSFLIPLALAGMLATLFLPATTWLEKKKMPRWLAALLCMFALLLIIAGVGTLVGWQLSNLAENAGTIKQKASESFSAAQQFVTTHLKVNMPPPEELLKKGSSDISKFAQASVGSFFEIFTGLVLTLVYVFLLLFYRSHIKQFIVKLTPTDQQPEMEKMVSGAAKVSQQYLLGMAQMIGCLWVMYSIGFGIIGVDNFFFFAILCGMLEIVPFIGNILGTTITVFVAAASGAGAPLLGGIVITYGIVQLLQTALLEPLILGSHVKINPLFTIMALVVGQLVWGIPGIIIAIPSLAIIKIMCDHTTSLKPYGFLIGEIENKKTSPSLFDKIKGFFTKKASGKKG